MRGRADVAVKEKNQLACARWHAFMPAASRGGRGRSA
jgi:hypothetical protein